MLSDMLERLSLASLSHGSLLLLLLFQLPLLKFTYKFSYM